MIYGVFEIGPNLANAIGGVCAAVGAIAFFWFIARVNR